MVWKTIDPSEFMAVIVGVPFWGNTETPAQIEYDDIEKIDQKYIIEPNVEVNGINDQKYVGIIITGKQQVGVKCIDYVEVENARREIIDHVYKSTGVMIKPSIYFEASHEYKSGY